MKVLYGYLFAFAGLIGLGLNSAVGSKYFSFVEGISSYLLIGSLVLIVLGVVIMIIMGKGGGSSKKIKHVTSEVPIYQGEGKKRKIVGYKVED